MYGDGQDATENEDVEIPLDDASDVDDERHVEVDPHALEYEDEDEDSDTEDIFGDENNNETVMETFLSRDGRRWNPNSIGQRRKLRHNVFIV